MHTPSSTTASSSAVIPFQARPKNGYLKLTNSLLQSPAWESLSAIERALYIDVASKFNGYNNGQISYSIGDGAKALHVSRRTVRRALKTLQRLDGAVHNDAMRDASASVSSDSDAIPRPLSGAYRVCTGPSKQKQKRKR
jgi:hypothetical protein